MANGDSRTQSPKSNMPVAETYCNTAYGLNDPGSLAAWGQKMEWKEEKLQLHVHIYAFGMYQSEF